MSISEFEPAPPEIFQAFRRLIDMNKKTLIAVVIIVALGVGLYYVYSARIDNELVINNPNDVSVIYNNTDYGFTFSLPDDWEGYSIIKDAWKGNSLTNGVAPTGSEIIIRNPNWTVTAPYEDLPVLIFTIPQWNAYLTEDFSVSAAPIPASELARNNMYVFALPPRWDFDYSIGYEEAQAIIAGSPLHAFDLEDIEI